MVSGRNVGRPAATKKKAAKKPARAATSRAKAPSKQERIDALEEELTNVHERGE